MTLTRTLIVIALFAWLCAFVWAARDIDVAYCHGKCRYDYDCNYGCVCASTDPWSDVPVAEGVCVAR